MIESRYLSSCETAPCPVLSFLYSLETSFMHSQLVKHDSFSCQMFSVLCNLSKQSLSDSSAENIETAELENNLLLFILHQFRKQTVDDMFKVSLKSFMFNMMSQIDFTNYFRSRFVISCLFIFVIIYIYHLIARY